MAELVEERAVSLKENQQSFLDNTYPVLARGTGFGQVQNNKRLHTFHRFDAEMAELVEERDVTNSIKEYMELS